MTPRERAWLAFASAGVLATNFAAAVQLFGADDAPDNAFGLVAAALAMVAGVTLVDVLTDWRGKQ